MIRALASSLVIVLVTLAPVDAETVFIRSGQHEGQGWIFQHESGCWVATAGHVVVDGAGVIVVGPNGKQSQAVRTVRHPTLDIALLELAGTTLRDCPASSLGDRDELAMLDRLLHQDGGLRFERRSGEAGKTAGISYGVETIAMQILGISEQEPLFTVRPVDPARDRIVRSDSGGPLRFRGAGFDEAGLPLGLVLDVRRDTVIAVRMDAVRSFMESLVAAQRPAPTVVAIPFTIAAFTGETPDSSCAPLNLLDPASHCGWRAKRSRVTRIGLTLDLHSPRAITAVVVAFEKGATPAGLEVSSGSDPASATDWYGIRYCRVPPGASQIMCTVGQRIARAVRIFVDGTAAHIRSVRVIEGP